MENNLGRSHSLKPPRRKLQKPDPKLKSLNKAKRGSTDSHSSSTMASLSPQSTTFPSPSQRQMSNGAPDLSDSKWDHYLRPKTVFVPSLPESEEVSEHKMNSPQGHQPVQHPIP